jgi:hypothetical protein
VSQVVAAVRGVRERLTDPRAWVQREWAAYRDQNGVVHKLYSGLALVNKPNCFCLGEMITRVLIHSQVGAAFTELRSDVERELLTTLELGAEKPPAAIYLWNDARTTSHADVLALLDKTIERLAPKAA